MKWVSKRKQTAIEESQEKGSFWSFSSGHYSDALSLPRSFLTRASSRLSQMILDKTLHGILDQGAGCLVVFDEPEEDVSFLSHSSSFLGRFPWCWFLPPSLSLSTSWLWLTPFTSPWKSLFWFALPSESPQKTYEASLDTLETCFKCRW